MTAADLEQVVEPTSRNAERRRELRAAAALLFRRRGFDGVGIDDIGAEVGVSGPAVYRYFPSKQAILAEIIAVFQTSVASRVGELAPYDALCETVLEDPDGAVVLLRQRRYLEATADASMRSASGGVGALMDVLGTGQEDLASTVSLDALRLRGAMGALLHVGLARAGTAATRSRIADEMAPVIGNVELSDRQPNADELLAADPEVMTHVSRREAILAAATKLFRARSYHGVSLRDIGAEVAITASAVSRHFDSKESLLAVMYDRAAAQIAGGMATALRRSGNADEAIVKLVRRYVDIAIDYRDLIAIYSTEMHFLPADYRDLRRRNQRGYVDELAHVVRSAYPRLSQAQSRIRAGASFAIVNEVIMHDGLVRRRNLPRELTALALSVVRDDPEDKGRIETVR